MRRSLALSIALGFFLSSCQSTQSLSSKANQGTVAGLPKIAEVEGIKEFQLENGLKVILFPDPSKPRITVNMTYFVGSRNEGAGEAGMAHLLEHMLFKGTPTRPDIWKMLQQQGANFNGTTSYDRTNYYEVLPASKENLDFALALEADRMVNSTITAEHLAKEFSVVRNEFEIRNNDPDHILYEYMLNAAFQWHNYGRSPIGNQSDIERVPVDRLKDFYQKYYQPDNAMLIVSGAFEEADALERIKKHFEDIPRPKRTLPEYYTVEPVQEGERQILLRRQGEQAAVGLLYHAVSGADPLSPAVDAVVTALTHKPSGLLYKELVTKGYATEVYGDASAYADPGAVIFMAKVAKGKDPKEVSQRLIALVEGLKPTQITANDLKRYKANFSREFDLGITDSARIGIVLSEYASQGDWRLLFLNRDRVEALKVEDLYPALAFFKASNRTAGLFIPSKNVDKAPTLAKVDIKATLKDYKGRGEISGGEAFAASFESIEQRTEFSQFTNGMKVALLPKKTRGEIVSFQIDLPSGDAKTLKNRLIALHVLPKIMLRGTSKRDYETLRDDLALLKTRASGSAGWNVNDPSNISFEFTTVKSKLPEVLSLAHEILTEPRFDPAQFQLIKQELLTALKDAKLDPQSLTGRAFYRAIANYPKDDVRHIPSIEEEIKAIEGLSLSEVKSVYKQLLGGSYGRLVMIGDFDANQVKEQLGNSIGKWASPAPYTAVTYEAKPVDSKLTVFDTPDKKAAQVFVGQTFSLKESDPVYPASRIASFIWGESISSRLMNRLRQKDGLSYGTGGSFRADARGNLGYLSAAAACAPQNIEKAAKAINEELALFQKNGITEQELKDAKAAYAEERRSNLARDGYIVNILNRNLEMNRSLAFNKELDQKIEALKLEEVNQFIKDYANTSQLFTIQALDRKAGDIAKAQ